MSPEVFSPDGCLTYAEAVKLAVCMHQFYTANKAAMLTGKPAYVANKVSMPLGDPWYHSYVDYAKIHNIINNDYEWDSPATRAGYMEIFANVLPDKVFAEINAIPSGAIADVPETHVNAVAIYKLYRAGIVQGVNDHHDCEPSSNISRAEVAVILGRMIIKYLRVTFTIIV